MTHMRPTTPRWATVTAALVWLATLLMGLAILWVAFLTRTFVDSTASAPDSAAPGADDILILRLVMTAFCVITLGYATVGVLLAGRPGAGRIGAILLAGGFLFALVPFGYVVGGFLVIQEPGSPVFRQILLLGPVALGPGAAAILPLLAIAFPDGRLPSPRWRVPVAMALTAVGLAALVQLVRPDTFANVGANNPIGIAGLPAEFGQFANIVTPLSVIVLTLMGIIAVVVRHRRGTAIERQQGRWFMAAVALAALPLSLSFVRPFGGPIVLLIASFGLLLVPIAVGIAVTRYRLYEIDRLINRTLVYVPLTALVAGLYAAIVTLLQRLFQSATGDRSDAAIVISTLILASVFTPLRKWLEGIVDRRFKAPAHPPAPAADAPGSPEWEGRVAAIALDVVRRELAATGSPEPLAVKP